MIILPRRRFLMGPAIVAATSLMPGHSIAKLLAPPPRKFTWVEEDPMSRALGLPPNKGLYWGFTAEGGGPYLLTKAEVKLFRDYVAAALAQWHSIVPQEK